MKQDNSVIKLLSPKPLSRHKLSWNYKKKSPTWKYVEQNMHLQLQWKLLIAQINFVMWQLSHINLSKQRKIRSLPKKYVIGKIWKRDCHKNILSDKIVWILNFNWHYLFKLKLIIFWRKKICHRRKIGQEIVIKNLSNKLFEF